MTIKLKQFGHKTIRRQGLKFKLSSLFVVTGYRNYMFEYKNEADQLDVVVTRLSVAFDLDSLIANTATIDSKAWKTEFDKALI